MWKNWTWASVKKKNFQHVKILKIFIFQKNGSQHENFKKVSNDKIKALKILTYKIRKFKISISSQKKIMRKFRNSDIHSLFSPLRHARAELGARSWCDLLRTLWPYYIPNMSQIGDPPRKWIATTLVTFSILTRNPL